MRTFFRWYYNLDPFAVRYIVPLSYFVVAYTTITEETKLYQFTGFGWFVILLGMIPVMIFVSAPMLMIHNWMDKRIKNLGLKIGIEKPEQ